MESGESIKQLHHFFGSVNFAPTLLVSATKSSTKCWTSRQKQVYGKIKLMIVPHIILSSADLNLSYDIKPDASDYQLGAIVKQKVTSAHDLPTLMGGGPRHLVTNISMPACGYKHWAPDSSSQNKPRPHQTT
jgi:hypothetical protein